jgi:hypothetical protein
MNSECAGIRATRVEGGLTSLVNTGKENGQRRLMTQRITATARRDITIQKRANEFYGLFPPAF